MGCLFSKRDSCEPFFPTDLYMPLNSIISMDFGSVAAKDPPIFRSNNGNRFLRLINCLCTSNCYRHGGNFLASHTRRFLSVLPKMVQYILVMDMRFIAIIMNR